MSIEDHPQLQRCYDLAIKGSWQHPFFLIPLGHCEWFEGNPDHVKTAMVCPIVQDKNPIIQLHINTEWITSVPDDQIFGLLCHEILHCMLQHHERSGGKNLETWGEATDMAINQSLVSSGIKIPTGGLLPPDDSTEDASEELYDKLEKREIPKPRNSDSQHVGRGCVPQKSQTPASDPGESPAQGQGDGQGEGQGDGQGNDPGDGEGDQSSPFPGQSESSDRAWGEMAAQAQVMSRGTGSAKVIARLFTPAIIKTKWDRLLKRAANRALSKGGRDNQTFARVNRRSGDIVLPGWISHRPSITAIIDSSGSVSDQMLRSALTSVVQCAKVSGVRVFLAVHDGRCYFADWIKPETTVAQISALCSSRGGTDPAGAFEAVQNARAKFDAGVYLTDGEVGQYPDKPSNVKRMIVGVLGDHKSSYRAEIPESWLEVAVEIDGEIGIDLP